MDTWFCCWYLLVWVQSRDLVPLSLALRSQAWTTMLRSLVIKINTRQSIY